MRLVPVPHASIAPQIPREHQNWAVYHLNMWPDFLAGEQLVALWRFRAKVPWYLTGRYRFWKLRTRDDTCFVLITNLAVYVHTKEHTHRLLLNEITTVQANWPAITVEHQGQTVSILIRYRLRYELLWLLQLFAHLNQTSPFPAVEPLQWPSTLPELSAQIRAQRPYLDTRTEHLLNAIEAKLAAGKLTPAQALELAQKVRLHGVHSVCGRSSAEGFHLSTLKPASLKLFFEQMVGELAHAPTEESAQRYELAEAGTKKYEFSYRLGPNSTYCKPTIVEFLQDEVHPPQNSGFRVFKHHARRDEYFTHPNTQRLQERLLQEEGWVLLRRILISPTAGYAQLMEPTKEELLTLAEPFGVTNPMMMMDPSLGSVPSPLPPPVEPFFPEEHGLVMEPRPYWTSLYYVAGGVSQILTALLILFFGAPVNLVVGTTLALVFSAVPKVGPHLAEGFILFTLFVDSLQIFVTAPLHLLYGVSMLGGYGYPWGTFFWTTLVLLIISALTLDVVGFTLTVLLALAYWRVRGRHKHKPTAAAT